MINYYELLGVQPTAEKEEIRVAYREALESEPDAAAKAELNTAWNTLSDPSQRARFDKRLMAGEPEPSNAVDALEVVEMGESPVRASGNAKLEPTVVLPKGMYLAEKKPRGLALMFDFSVLFVLAILCQQFIPPMVDSSYSEARTKYDKMIELIAKEDKKVEKANKSADSASKAAKKAEKAGDTIEAASKQEEAANERADAKAAKADSAKLTKQAEVIANEKLRTPFYAAIGLTLLLALAYCVIPSAMTGQTLGKKLRRIKLVRVDGSKAGWGASLAHFSVPLLLAVVLSNFLGPLALLLALGSVLWFMRDRNRQGLHDRLAKTLVVEAPTNLKHR